MSSDPSPVYDLRAPFGVQARVTASAESTNGEFVEMDCVVDAGGGTTLHTHPSQEERYEVLEGALDLYSDGEWRAVPAGEVFVVPPGEVHAFRNNTDGPVRFLNRHTPALRFQEHFETVDRLVRAGKIRGLKDPRSLMYLCMSAVENEPDVQVSPPPWVIRGMAFLGRRLGFTLDPDRPQSPDLHP